MNTQSKLGLLFFSVLYVLGVAADTREVSNIAYFVTIDDGNEITVPNGGQVTVGIRSHANVVDKVTGEDFSQWCVGEAGTDTGAGYCTLVADNGDALWVSYVFMPGEEGSSWTIMGGTGQYAGATGSGTTSNVSERGDGRAWTSKSVGTLTTK